MTATIPSNPVPRNIVASGTISVMPESWMRTITLPDAPEGTTVEFHYDHGMLRQVRENPVIQVPNDPDAPIPNRNGNVYAPGNHRSRAPIYHFGGSRPQMVFGTRDTEPSIKAPVATRGCSSISLTRKVSETNTKTPLRETEKAVKKVIEKEVKESKLEDSIKETLEKHVGQRNTEEERALVIQRITDLVQNDSITPQQGVAEVENLLGSGTGGSGMGVGTGYSSGRSRSLDVAAMQRADTLRRTREVARMQHINDMSAQMRERIRYNGTTTLPKYSVFKRLKTWVIKNITPTKKPKIKHVKPSKRAPQSFKVSRKPRD